MSWSQYLAELEKHEATRSSAESREWWLVFDEWWDWQ